MALGRVTPSQYQADVTFRRWVATAPFGSYHETDRPPLRQKSHLIRGTIPGIGHDDFVIFFGGIYNWYDPFTLLAAVKQLLPQFPQIRVIFSHTSHPDTTPHTQLDWLYEWAAQNELLNRVVFFLPWFPYAERHRYLVEMDLAVCLHREGLETDLSFRTRLVDYLHFGLPIVTTDGGGAEPHLRKAKGVHFVPPEDAETLATVLYDLITSPKVRHEMGVHNREYAYQNLSWQQSFAPLIAYCQSPYPGPPRHAPSFFSVARDYVRHHGLRNAIKRWWQRT